MEIDFQERGIWLARHLLPHEPVLRARVRRMNICGLEVDDVIQEVYARIVSQPSLDVIKYPLQYAMRTATAVVIDHMRHARVIPIHAMGTLNHLEVLSPDVSAEQRLEFREEIAAVAGLLAQLPERTREILILRRIQGLSQRETSERLGISVKTVEKHMAQGVAALMALFGRGGKTAHHPSVPIWQSESDVRDQKTKPPGD
jgi:RNA polymerase sigma factor (sigma-70 family)